MVSVGGLTIDPWLAGSAAGVGINTGEGGGFTQSFWQQRIGPLRPLALDGTVMLHWCAVLPTPDPMDWYGTATSTSTPLDSFIIPGYALSRTTAVIKAVSLGTQLLPGAISEYGLTVGTEYPYAVTRESPYVPWEWPATAPQSWVGFGVTIAGVNLLPGSQTPLSGWWGGDGHPWAGAAGIASIPSRATRQPDPVLDGLVSPYPSDPIGVGDLPWHPRTVMFAAFFYLGSGHGQPQNAALVGSASSGDLSVVVVARQTAPGDPVDITIPISGDWVCLRTYIRGSAQSLAPSPPLHHAQRAGGGADTHAGPSRAQTTKQGLLFTGKGSLL